jgi:putative chitinase
VIVTRQIILTANNRHPTAELTAMKMTLALAQFKITDPRSAGALLANLTVESGIIPKREDLYYRTADRLMAVFPSTFDPAHGGRFPTAPYMGNPVALGNLVYAGKLGNGDVASGDGYRNRGGGYIQTTGETNYLRTGELIGQPLAQHPELIEQIGVSCQAACAYWTRMSSADQLARQGNISGTRYAVNGRAGLGMAEMLAVYQRLLPLLVAS